MPKQQIDDASLPAGDLERRQARGPGAGGKARSGFEGAEREDPRRNAEAPERRGGSGGLGRGIRP